MEAREARELRIGNYVDVPIVQQCPFRIDSIEHLHPRDNFGKFGMYYDEFPNGHPLTWYLKDLKPIPLTEEWLIKFGFELFHYDFFDKDDLDFEEEDEEESCLVFRIIPKGYKFYYIVDLWVERNDFQFGSMGLDDTVHDSKGVGICNYNYVHQLQNLYFALTGQEL